MRKTFFITLTALLTLTTAASLPANILIDVANFAPNGSASGGSGTGLGALTTSEGSIGSDRGMPVTTYTVSGLDLSSLGGGAGESFSFTITYTATTDGSTPGTPVFNGFGNVAVDGGASNAQVDGAETLTATIALTSSSFAGLSLAGFTEARAGGVSDTESGTFAWDGGSFSITGSANRTATIDPTAGITALTLSVQVGQMNFEGFKAEFVAVPESSTFALLCGVFALGLILVRRRK